MKNFLNKIKNYMTTVIIPMFRDIQWLEIPVSTYVRWVLAIILSINTVLSVFDINPITISEHVLYEVISLILNIVVLIVNTYKNNSTSKEAIIADKIMHALKAATETDEETAIGKLNDILDQLNATDRANLDDIYCTLDNFEESQSDDVVE